MQTGKIAAQVLNVASHIRVVAELLAQILQLQLGVANHSIRIHTAEFGVVKHTIVPEAAEVSAEAPIEASAIVAHHVAAALVAIAGEIAALLTSTLLTSALLTSSLLALTTLLAALLASSLLAPSLLTALLTLTLLIPVLPSLALLTLTLLTLTLLTLSLLALLSVLTGQLLHLAPQTFQPGQLLIHIAALARPRRIVRQSLLRCPKVATHLIQHTAHLILSRDHIAAHATANIIR